jgi:predicted enzyme related to lactoylglutathione lyase
MAKVVHFEIPVDDPERASAFYREALGWEISRYGEEPYWMVQAGPEDDYGADGALIDRGEIHQSPVLILGVDSIDDAISDVQQAGAEILQGRVEIPEVGWSAYFVDSEGNTIGLFEAAPGSMPGM